KKRTGACELWIEVKCSPSECNPAIHVLAACKSLLADGSQKPIVGQKAFGRLSSCSRNFGLRHGRLDRSGDCRSNSILKIEDVFQQAVELVRPEMCTGIALDQLARNTNPVCGPPNAAFKHVPHPQLAADPTYVWRFSLV